MKTLEYHLPCYGRGVYSHNQIHERDERSIDFEINGIKYIFYYCDRCYKASIFGYSSDWGWLSLLLYYIFVESGLLKPFKMTRFGFNNKMFDNKALKWYKNREYTIHKEMENNSEYIKILSDSYNTYYVKRNLFL